MVISLVCNGNQERFDGGLICALADHVRGRSPRLAARLEDAVAREASLELSDDDADMLLRSADEMITPANGADGSLSGLKRLPHSRAGTEGAGGQRFGGA
jgi:hypothetical protein